MRVRKGVTPKVFWEINLIFSIILFLLMYGILNSELFLSGIISLIYGESRLNLFHHFLIPEPAFIIICKYGRDFMLGYLLSIAICYLMRKEMHGYRYAFAICILIEVVIEFARMAVVIQELIAPWNFIAKLLGTCLAFVVIFFHEKKYY